MRVVIRADAGVEQGTGHVMRCLTLAEELIARGHSAILFTGDPATEWLSRVLDASAVDIRHCELDTLPATEIMALEPDWVVVDSYRIPAGPVSSLNACVSVLAIVDGDDRGIEATLYLDQNLGAEHLARRPITEGKFLSGAAFALVRKSVLSQRRKGPALAFGFPPKILIFMGGTDPTGAGLDIARSLAKSEERFALTFLAPQAQHVALRRILESRPEVRLLAPTPRLPELLGETDVVVSAAGTSAWDVCALGIPALLVAVVDNQQASLREAVRQGLVLGIDVTDDRGELEEKGRYLVASLLNDRDLCRDLSRACLRTFDGQGASRVVGAMEVRSDAYAA